MFTELYIFHSTNQSYINKSMLNIIMLFYFRAIEEKSSFLQAVFDYVTTIIKYMVSVVMKKHDELSHGLTSVGSAFEATGFVLSSFQTFLSAPIFRLQSVSNKVSSVLIKEVTELLDELLVAFSQLFSRLCSPMNTSNSENTSNMLPISSVNLSEDLNPVAEHKSIVDMDLDVMDSGEVDSITASVSGSIGVSSRPLEWKLELVSVISTFFSVSPPHTWEVLYNLVEKESDMKVQVCNQIFLMFILLLFFNLYNIVYFLKFLCRFARTSCLIFAEIYLLLLKVYLLWYCLTHL